MCTIPCPDVHAALRSQTDHAEALLQAYAPLIKSIAQRLACRLPASVAVEDLISSGVIGLLDAIAKYDVQRATTFKTYATCRIRGAMLDDLRDLDWVPRSVRQKAHALTQAYTQLERQLGRAADDEEVAACLGLDLAAFHDWLMQVRGVSVLRLDLPAEPLRAGTTGTLLDTLSDEDAPSLAQVVETQHLSERLAQGIEGLPYREKVILSLYYHEELTMKEIGQVLDVTEARVSQLHTTAIFHLRAVLHSRHHDHDVAVGCF